MKTSIVALTSFLATAHGFSTHPFAARRTASLGNKLRMSSAADEVAALRAAAAKAREDAARLAQELGRPLEDTAAKTAAAKIVAKETISEKELKSLTSSIDFEGGDAISQSSKLDQLAESGDLKLWKSVALRSYPVSLGMLEQRTAGKVTGASLGITGEEVSLDDFKYATLGVTLGCSVLGILSLAVLPENIGPTLCYFFAIIPILFLGLGSSAPGIIAGAIAAARGTADSPDEKIDRICRHEAGHFLAGYCCGLPIKGYSLLDNTGIPCVEFHPSSEGDAGREFTADEIAALSVVAMSGSVAEALALGEAKGGQNDLLELEGRLRRSEDFVGAQKQQDLTRWGALTAYNLLKTNEEKFEALVSAFKEKKSVADCLAILESR